jgi:surface antigen
MTEREIPEDRGFPLGGKTNETQTSFAPLGVSKPDFLMNPELDLAAAEVDPAPVFLSRREMRAAGAYKAAPDAATPVVIHALVEPAARSSTAAVASIGLLTPIGGIASLFPLLGEVTAAPLAASVASPLAAQAAPPSAFEAILAGRHAPTTPAANVAQPATESTLAMPVADIAAELATPVAPIVIVQAPITVVVPVVPGAASPVLPIPPSPAHAPLVATGLEVKQTDVASTFGFAESVDQGPAERNGSRRAGRAKFSRAAAGPQSKANTTSEPNPAALRAASARKSIRQRITGVGVMVLVGGLFVVLALPAYADNNASSLSAASAIRTQKLAVSASSATSTTASVSRDGYTATSAADLKKLYSTAVRQQNIAAYLQSGAKAQGDDYPWFGELSRNQGGGLSPLNYYYRECVDFVAWRLNRDAGSTTAPFKWVWSNLTPSGGNASQWKSAWLNHGWATGITPKVGAVAWFPYNHVAYVSGILNDGSVALEEYNWQGQHSYSMRIIQPGDAYYLYAPPA